MCEELVMKHRKLTMAVLVSSALFGGAGVADAGPPGKWTQVTGIGKPDSNTVRLGLARTADRALHVGWTQQGAGTEGSILHSSISANAKSVSGPHPIASYSGGSNADVALVRGPAGTGVRAVFAGLGAGAAVDEAMATAVSADGVSWSVAPSPASRVGDNAKPVYAALGLDARLGLDGTVYSIWGDSTPGGGGFHAGLDPGAADGELPGGLKSDPGIAVDARSGQVVAAWNVIGGGVVAMALSPLGQPATLPNSDAAQLGHQVAITGRIGAPGIFVAYTQGTNEFTGDPALFRVDTGKATKLSSRNAQKISIAAAPSGRLWVFWKEAGTVFATRSNTAATRFGAMRRIKVPGGNSSTIFDLAGEASTGPLDLLALISPPGGHVANFHQRVLPGLTVTTSKAKNRTIFRVTDAGEPVAKATVKVRGVGSKTTGRDGSARFALRSGNYTGRASRPGYASDSVRVRVK